MLVPKLVTTLKTYDRAQFVADLGAGAIVGVVALPLAIAFGIASGVTPGAGLWTAIVAGALISALGGSRVQIGGPTGAFVVIVAGIVEKYGTGGLATATLMAGVMLVTFGLLRFGKVIQFFPRPVITGFTAGIAVLIASGQVKDALGLHMGTPPVAFIEKWVAYGAHLGDATPAAMVVFAGTLVLLIAWPRISTKVPGPFVALVAATVAVQLLHLPVETVGSRFGALPTGWPAVQLPDLSLGTLRAMVAPAFTIALLGGVESLLSAVVADGMIGGRHRPNMELVAQGVANIASPLVGGIPATGAIARTATNARNGGLTPVAGLVHAATLLAITLFAGQWAALIPMCALAAILLIVSYHMSEWRTVRAEMKAPRSDVVVLLLTLALTVLVDLTVAIQVGLVLASLLFVRRMAGATSITAVADDDDEGDGELRAPLPPGVQLFAMSGPFFFGAAEQFKETMRQVASRPRVLILQMRDVPVIDATAMHALREVVRQSEREGTRVLIAEAGGQPMDAMRRAGLVEELGVAAFAPSVEYAIAQAAELAPLVARKTPR
ncbi:MAG: STAS domain-containing protein [Gemmatimonadetes bacterium]|nr:STAS domain-containing protein [Gemmatimonadota bacterium]